MKIMKIVNLLWIVALLLVFNNTRAQTFKISTFGQESILMGDISKKEINNAKAGYVDYGSTSGLELNYYLKNNFGFGLRWKGTFYGQDIDTYESDIKKMLGISGNNYDFAHTYGFWSFGSDFGISYLIGISEKLQLEPYFYFGATGLSSPKTEIIFMDENTTFQYVSKSQTYFGISYSPGVKLNWNITKLFGLYFSAEYLGKSFIEDKERSILYSYNTLEITDTEKSYSINSFNIGLGLAFRFGKQKE